MAQIEVVESKIIIKEFVLDDKDAALLLSEIEPEKREEAVKTALRLGFLMYRHARVGVNVDFVRREFEQVVTEIKNHWDKEVKAKINEVITNYFDLQTGTVPKKLAEYFGDGTQAGKVAELFNEKNTESITYQLRQIIQKELTGENSAFIKALNPEDEKTPIGRLKKKIEQPITDLRNEIIKEKAAKEMAETGTQKGGPYEDLVFGYVDRIAAAFNDKAEDVSNQNVAGDYVVTLHPEAVPGQTLKVVIDAKDKSMGLKDCESMLAEAKTQWGTQTSLLVFARQDQTPGAPIALRRLTEGYICVFDKEALDTTVLQAAYQIVRLDAIRGVQRAALQIDTAQVQQKLEQAIQKLQDFATLKRRLTEAIKDLRAIREFVSSLRDDLRDRLEEAWTALGVKAPMPVLPEEPETPE